MRAAAPTSAALRGRSMPFLSLAMTLGLVLSAVRITAPPPTFAEHTPNPTSVTIAGDLQSELGCTFDWDAGCATTHLSHDANDDVWQGTWTVPAGSWEYKAALNDNWDENYGLHAQPNGANIPLAPGSATSTKFYYDHKTHWITDSLGSVIAVAPGNFQSEIGCSSDWDPSCLRSWLQDPDGDGTYLFVTTAIAAGSYEAKVAINEGWDENYGRDGVFNGPNIPFNVPATGNEVTFSYVAATHILTISVAGVHAPDNNVEWFGLRHDSRSDVYRTPGGAVPAGTPVALRFRTFHNDVTAVKTRFYSVQQGGQQIVPMELAAGGIGCYEPGLEDELCDFWELTLPEEHGADNLWYRFIVSDGTDTDYYADDTPALDGGLGATTDDAVDQSWALMLHVPGFESPTWAPHAVIYQIFPDRFRNGRANNDPHTGDLRYDDPVLKLPWGTLPEGFCRNYADGNVNCPWRFDDTPPPSSPTKEQPRGRDYMGGDLRGVDQQLGYLATLGVSAIYFNPVFDAGSNHSYDTQDYTRIDPYFGTAKDWENLVKHADALGIRIILDGVFNHLSSDSPFFDRYHHYPSVGACEDENSIYRSWFFFQDVAPGSGHCVSSTGAANGALYSGWFGFDSIPVINKGLQAVQEYFLTDEDAITARWLEDGASGWRMDVSGDPSFPDGYWETFRAEVDESDPDALTISETWQKDSTLLRMLRGDRLDTTMNYRLRDAVIGFLTPGPFDSKGFADSGNVISANDFANRLAAIREDYPDAAYYSLMNLLDSHDTERLLWTLTPGAETRAEKELNAANLAAGKARMRVASLIQFTVPGAPTVYYGDEVGMTGDDDPDDRRTYPWADKGGSPDTALLAYYQGLTAARAENPALTEGDFRVLLADDSSGTVAYGRKTDAQGALVALNRSSATQTLELQVSGYLPDGLLLDVIIAANAPSGGSYAVSGGELSVSLPAMSGLVLASGEADLQPPAAPTDLSVTDEAANQVSLAWDPVSGAAGYDVYYSPLSGGGYVKANGGPVTGTSFTVTGLQNARPYFFVVTALDSAGNASQPSNEVEGIPHLVIGWANLQWPPTMMHTISTVDRTDTAYGQVWIDGPNGTSQPGPTPSLRAQLGFGPAGSNPTAASWTWVEASFNVDAGNNDEFAASMLPEAVGTYHYVYRYTATAGRDWLYADLNGPIPSGELPANPGVLTVNPSGDTTAPAVPTALLVESASPAGIELSWEAVLGDASLYGYEVGRSSSSGGPYAVLALVTGQEQFTDASVAEGATYYYVVRAIDTSFNRSEWSDEVPAIAELRTVTVTFNVEIPAWSPAGLGVYIAGTLSRFDGGYPDWDPNVVPMTEVDPTSWTITFTGLEGTLIEYKYALYHTDDWFHVEKDGGCGEIANRQLTLSYGVDGTQEVNDVVANWRNVAPCGN